MLTGVQLDNSVRAEGHAAVGVAGRRFSALIAGFASGALVPDGGVAADGVEAGVGAIVVGVCVGIVALLTGVQLNNTVRAQGHAAVGIAGRRFAALIASLASGALVPEGGIPAHGVEAGVGAIVVGVCVGVVALLTGVRLDNSVRADGHAAVSVAGRRCAALIASLASIDDPVPT